MIVCCLYLSVVYKSTLQIENNYKKHFRLYFPPFNVNRAYGLQLIVSTSNNQILSLLSKHAWIFWCYCCCFCTVLKYNSLRQFLIKGSPKYEYVLMKRHYSIFLLSLGSVLAFVVIVVVLGAVIIIGCIAGLSVLTVAVLHRKRNRGMTWQLYRTHDNIMFLLVYVHEHT